jgi:hypothetical protein
MTSLYAIMISEETYRFGLNEDSPLQLVLSCPPGGRIATSSTEEELSSLIIRRGFDSSQTSKSGL